MARVIEPQRLFLAFLLDFYGGYVIPFKTDVPTVSTKTAVTKPLTNNRSSTENCKRIRAPGYTTSRHIKMYGQHLELVSNPFEEGGCTSVWVLSGNDPIAHSFRLPVAILVGLSERFRKT
jgi:hypothetical protein